MLTLELSFIVVEMPNDAYTTLSRNLIGYSTLSQEYCEPDWLILENNEKSNIKHHHALLAYTNTDMRLRY